MWPKVLESTDIEEVLSVMESRARELGLEGVAVVDIYPRTADGERIRHHPLHVREIGNYVITDSKGAYNCYGIVFMKVAGCRRSRQPSGFLENGLQPFEGESPYRGAVYLEHLLADTVLAFSGGSQKQDLMIASAGASRLKWLLDRQIQDVAREVDSDWTPFKP